ncbi:MAG: hypothetical protein R3B57_08180 [Phycisphaerales bacterium]
MCRAQELGGGLAGGLSSRGGEARGEELVVVGLGGEAGELGGGDAAGLGGDEVGALAGQAGQGGEALTRARVVEPGDEVVDLEEVVGGEGGEADVGGEVVGEEGFLVAGIREQASGIRGRRSRRRSPHPGPLPRGAGEGGRNPRLRGLSIGVGVVQERGDAVVWAVHRARYGAGRGASAMARSWDAGWRARGVGMMRFSQK